MICIARVTMTLARPLAFRPASLPLCPHRTSLLKRFHAPCNTVVARAEFPEGTDSSDMPKGFGKPRAGGGGRKDMTQKDALIQSLSAVGRLEGRKAQGRQVVLGGDTAVSGEGGQQEAVSKWKELDSRIGTEYPCMRHFKAIGAADESYAEMVRTAVSESIGYAVPAMMVQTRESRKGNYWTVDVGPVEVKAQEQVIEAYSRIKADPRTKFMM